MIIFLDTEFSSLPAGELLSIGLAPIDREQPIFYYENSDNNPNFRSSFTQENVVPLLQGKSHSISRLGIQMQLIDYLNRMGDTQYTFVADYVHDFALLHGLMNYGDENHEKQFNYRCAFRSNALFDVAVERGYGSGKLINEAIEKFSDFNVQYFEISNLKPHHALNDAFAQRYAWEQCFQWLKERTQ